MAKATVIYFFDLPDLAEREDLHIDRTTFKFVPPKEVEELIYWHLYGKLAQRWDEIAVFCQTQESLEHAENLQRVRPETRIFLVPQDGAILEVSPPNRFLPENFQRFLYLLEIVLGEKNRMLQSA